MTTPANPTINLNDTTPAAPGGTGLSVKWQASGTDPRNVSAYLPCPGGTSTFLRADGTFASVASTLPLTTAGDLLFENATPTPARLPIGSTGNVLTVVAGLPAWAPPTTPAPAFQNKTTAGAIATVGLVWLNTGAGGAFTLANGANNGDMVTIVISKASVSAGLTWTITFTGDFGAYGTLTFTTASVTANKFGSAVLMYGPNGWCVIDFGGGTLT